MNNNNAKMMELMQLKAIKQDLFNIKDIKEPTEKVQMMVIKKDPMYFQYINNPHTNVRKKALKYESLDNSILRYIKNPTNEEKRIAVKTFAPSIGYIKNPSKELLIMAAKKSIGHEMMDLMDEEFQLKLVNISGDVIKYMPNASEKVRLAAVINSGWAIRHINNPSDIVQIAAMVALKPCGKTLIFPIEGFVNNGYYKKITNKTALEILYQKIQGNEYKKLVKKQMKLIKD